MLPVTVSFVHNYKLTRTKQHLNEQHLAKWLNETEKKSPVYTNLDWKHYNFFAKWKKVI